MYFLFVAGFAAAQTAAGPSGAWFTQTAGEGAQISLDCRSKTGAAATVTTTQTLQITDFAWARDWIRASIRNYEAELSINYILQVVQIGRTEVGNSLGVALSDASGPVKAYDYTQNLWTSAPVSVPYGANNFSGTVWLRLHRRADFDSLTLTVSNTASGTCLGTDGGDGGYAAAGVTSASLGYW